MKLSTAVPASAFLYMLALLCSQPVSAATATPGEILEELIVTASRLPDAPPALDVAGLQQAATPLLTSLELTDALRDVAGVTVSNAGGLGKVTTLQIRGEAGYRTRLLVDGIELADVSAPQVTSTMQHLFVGPDIARVDVLAGPHGFLHGADAGGVVHVQTPHIDTRLAGDLLLEGSAYDTFRGAARLGAGNRRGGAAVAVQRLRSAGFNARTDDTLRRDNDGYDHITVHGRGQWRPTANSAIDVVVRHVDATTEFDACGFPTSNDCIEDFAQTSLRIAGSVEGARLQHRFAASTSDVERDNAAAGASSFAASGRLSRYEYGVRFATDTLGIAAGLEHRAEEAEDDERGQTGAFVETAWQALDALHVGAGVRFDDNDDFGQHTSVRLNGAYTYALDGRTELRLRSSFGTGFRAPSLFEVGYNRGPFAFPPASLTTLREERSKGIDVGMDLLSARYSVALTVFSQRIEDAIEFDLSGFSGYLQQDGTARSRGMTLRAAYQPAPAIRLTASYMYNRAKAADGSTRIRRPRHSGTVAVNYGDEQAPWHAGLSVRFSRRALDQRFGGPPTQLSDYAVVDSFVSRRVTDRLRVFVRLNNALDDKAQELLDFRAAGATVAAGIRAAL